ncbi:hypothetical protein HO173_004860 [Letharia columbiana]|uniref:N-acetyltransferase domain-containing protein n=1 Tax=Letharia columbiana TaxID=112416 RepID=A0A8H6L622_9LECA|nr:uncharacterized protein HO173_004860 [Letharia columbiana]KAF6236981.1 hypothetical protein HO173_004860 [Letharia columbiana]
MTESSLPVATIRRCLYRDLDRVIPIYNHYVSNTIVSLDLDTKPILYMQKLYNSVLDQDLPFLIVTISNDHTPARKEEDIIGYAYANFYRRLPAFGGTVEILIYLDPNATGQGIGKRLLDVLMVTLKEVTPATDRDHGIREVLAIVPVDEGRDASGFFRKGGFEDRGLLKGVGWKMGRWIDTRTFQRSLAEEPKDGEKAVQKKRQPKRHWWSSVFRRR